MNDFLNQFSKRMEFVAIVDSIVGRTNKNQEIERLFSDGELDNILMSLLVFIMETTLTEEQDCTIEAITDFLSGILPSYGHHMSITQLEELSRYLVKDILQNKGEMRSSMVMDYPGGMKSLPVRLVADKLGENKRILFELTKQGFDFLFRTKEVDDELGFEIEAIRLRMLISKKNYKKAMSQSKYILAMLIEKRNELRQFEQQLRHDVYTVSGEQYDTVVRSVYDMLFEEYEIMSEIERMLVQAQAHLNEEIKHNAPPGEKSKTAQLEIVYISENVQRALELQRELLIKCNSMEKLYLSMLEDALIFHQVKRFDIEEQVLGRMERMAFSDASALNTFCAALLTPIFMPDISKSLNLSLIYQRQAKIRETADGGGVINEEETVAQGEKQERIRRRNDAHALLIRLLFEFAKERASFLLSDFWDRIKTHNRIEELTAQRLMFLAMLKLYEIREIDIDKWHEEEIHTLECMGEFDLDYCLMRCDESDETLLAGLRMIIDKTGQRVVCETSTEAVTIDDLSFLVRS